MQGLPARAGALYHHDAGAKLVTPEDDTSREDVMMVPEVAGVSSELARSGAGAAASNGAPAELQRTCVAVLRAEWSTLAVVAVDPLSPARDLAQALADTAHAYRLRPVRALNGTGAAAPQVARLLDALAQSTGSGERVVIAVDDPIASPARMPLVFAADAVLLLVRLGTSTFRAVAATAELVGRERIVGCVVIPG